VSEIETRGLQSEDIYKIPVLKSEVNSILTSFHRLEEIDISTIDINTVAAVLKGWLRIFKNARMGLKNVRIGFKNVSMGFLKCKNGLKNVRIGLKKCENGI